MVAQEQGMAEAADEQCRVRSQTRAEPDTRTVEDVRNNGFWRVFQTRGKETPTEKGKRSHRQKTDSKNKNIMEQEEKKRRWKSTPKGRGRTTKVLTINFDLDVLERIQQAPNKSRLVNDILRRFFNGNLQERK